MKDGLIQVWQLQWTRPSDVKPLDSSLPTYTVERFNRMVNGAYDAGHADGWSEGQQPLRSELYSIQQQFKYKQDGTAELFDRIEKVLHEEVSSKSPRDKRKAL